MSSTSKTRNENMYNTCNIRLLTSNKCVSPIFLRDASSCSVRLGRLHHLVMSRTLAHRCQGRGLHAWCTPSATLDASTSRKRKHDQCFWSVDESTRAYPRQDLVQAAWIMIPLKAEKSFLLFPMSKTQSSPCLSRFVPDNCYTHS